MIRRPLLWILGGWILGELLAGWLGLIQVPASSYYAGEQTEISLPFLETGRALLRESVRRISSDAAEDGLFAALILGDKRSLPEDIRLLFQNGGIAHIIAVSGLHLTLIANAVMFLLRKLRLSKKAAALAADAVLLLYVLMIGGSVSSWRAFVMFTVQTGALFAGRSYDGPSALGLAGLLILLSDPLYLYNVAFQLSFSAVYALGVAAPLLTRWLCAEKNLAARAVIASAAVQFVTFPIIAFHFYKLPLISLPLNLLVVPLTGAALASGFAAAVAALFYLPGGIFLSGLAHYIFLGIRWLCGLLAGFRGTVWVTGKPYGWQLALYYVLLSALLTVIRLGCKREERGESTDVERTAVRKKKRPAAVLLRAGSVLLLFLLMLLLKRPPRADLAVTALDVGQGDCLVVELPGGDAVLVDGGSSSVRDVGREVIVPYLQQQGLTTIRAVYLSHPDLDHINGIGPVMADPTITVQRTSAGRYGRENGGYEELQRAAEENGVSWSWLAAGDRQEIGDCCFTVLTEGIRSEDENSESLVLLMEYSGYTVLFTGDMEEEEEASVPTWPDIDLLKVAHHGSRFSTGEKFLSQTTPRLALISAGQNNLYGHPHPETLQRLAAVGAEVHCTADEGTVTVVIRREETAE